MLLLSKTREIPLLVALFTKAIEPKLILLSEESTVPTIDFALEPSPSSVYPITILLELLSCTNDILFVPPLSNWTGVPNEIDVPLTVPTTALPSVPSLKAITTRLLVLSNVAQWLIAVR